MGKCVKSKKSLINMKCFIAQKACVSNEGDCLELLAMMALTRNAADLEPLSVLLRTAGISQCFCHSCSACCSLGKKYCSCAV